MRRQLSQYKWHIALFLVIVILVGYVVFTGVEMYAVGLAKGVCRPQPYECSDCVDNDGDGKIDYKANKRGVIIGDPNCESETDNSEAACTPSQEVCDNKDNNCNSLIDENLTRQCGVSDVGECQFGTQTCVNGIWQNCDAVMPSDEVCAGGLDEDCNGLIDSKDPECLTSSCVLDSDCPSSNCSISYCEVGMCKNLKDPFCSNVTFTKMSPDPVPLFEGDWDPGAASDPSVIKDGNVYRMFYTAPGADGDSTAIWEATSSDGLAWDVLGAYRTAQGVVINYGARGTWEEKLETVDVIKLGNTYYAYYIGYDRNTSLGMEVFPSFLGGATSQDGVSFTKYGKPILKNQSNYYDYDSGVISPTVIEDGGHLYMVYTAHCYTQGQCLKTGVNLLGAENTSGPFNWKKTGLQLQYNSNVQWYKDGVAESSLIKVYNKYYLFFTGIDYQNGKRYIGIARSNNPNGPWEIRQDPIISPKNLGDFDYPEALAPDVIFENNKIRMWYTGFEGSSSLPEGAWKVGYAEADLTIYG